METCVLKKIHTRYTVYTEKCAIKHLKTFGVSQASLKGRLGMMCGIRGCAAQRVTFFGKEALNTGGIYELESP